MLLPLLWGSEQPHLAHTPATCRWAKDQPLPVYSPGLFCEFAPASFQVTGRELPKGRQNKERKGTWPGTRAEGTVKDCVGASGLEFSCCKNK